MESQINSSFSKLSDKLSTWFDAIIINLPNILIAIMVFMVAYWLSRSLQTWTNKYFKGIIRQASIRSLVSNVAAVVVISIGLLLSLSILNLDGTLKSLLAGAGVAGLAISLALQGALSNTFSGIFIAIKNEINPGDWIESNGYAGSVNEINLRNTKIKEADNNIVVIPNKLILENPFKNYGLTKQIRTTITCGVGYESDLERVRHIAIKAIEDIYPAQEGHQVEFYYTNFGGSAIDFLLRFWVDAEEKITALDVKSTAIMQIKKAFDKNHINIPFPIRTIISDN